MEARFSVKYWVAMIWNSLPTDQKETRSVLILRKNWNFCATQKVYVKLIIKNMALMNQTMYLKFIIMYGVYIMYGNLKYKQLFVF